jgi:hypothetical protein
VRWARSAAERRSWRIALGGLGAIYGSLYFLPFLLEFLRDRNLLRVALGALAATLLAAVVVSYARRGAGGREWAVLALIVAAYASVLARMSILQERLHLLEYGALALLVRDALRWRLLAGPPRAHPERDAALGALLLTAAAGWVDELLQGILPNRYYDLRDVGFNALAAAMALAAASLSAWAARAEARRAAARGRPSREG